MRVTTGYVVDVILNSLSGYGLRASWQCVAPFGRFIETGKADITGNSSLPSKRLSHYGIDSLMAVELRSWVNKDFGANVAVLISWAGRP